MEIKLKVKKRCGFNLCSCRVQFFFAKYSVHFAEWWFVTVSQYLRVCERHAVRKAEQIYRIFYGLFCSPCLEICSLFTVVSVLGPYQFVLFMSLRAFSAFSKIVNLDFSQFVSPLYGIFVKFVVILCFFVLSTSTQSYPVSGQKHFQVGIVSFDSYYF